MVVEFHAHFVVEFLAGLDVEVVDQGFPLGGGFRLVGVPEVQGLAAMPDGDAAVGVRAAGKADDHGLPLIGSRQAGHEIAELDRRIVRLDADLLMPSAMPLRHGPAHAIVAVGNQA